VRAGVDVTHNGAEVAVSGLGHDRLKGLVVLAEMHRRGMAQQVELPAGVGGE
jgi:hypothetical protein